MGSDLPLCDRLLSSDRAVALQAQREVLTAQMERPGPLTTLSMLASASKELRAINAELAALAPSTEARKLDELKSRREARHSAAVDSAPASRRGQSRRSNGSHRTS